MKSASKDRIVSRYYTARVARTPGAESVLRLMDATGRICIDHFASDEEGFTVVLTQGEIRTLRGEGLTVKVGPELLTRDRREDVDAGVLDDGGGPLDTLATGFTSSYLDAAQVAARMTSLAATFPAICHLSTLPESTAGYDGSVAGLAGPAAVQLLRITNTPGAHSKPGLLLLCGTHAREWMNPLIAIEFAEQLVRNYNPASVDPDVIAVNRIVEQCDTFIIPVLNPDGLNFSIHDEAGWRKNRNPADSAICPGIDNNRNYEVYFGGAGSDGAPCSDIYRGTGAFSEAENRNVRFVLEQHPNILVGVDSHSFGQDIFRPNPSGGSFIGSLPVSAADHAIYTSLENIVVAAIQAVNGNTYSTGTTSNHAGASDEYMFFAHRVFGFDFECGLSFQPPFAQALPVIQEVAAGLRALAAATIDLTVTTPTPARIVQCIDRTGSMIAFGYVEPARANARRFIDMMSLGDSIGIVSFADPSPNPAATPPANRATTELPLTLIDDPGDFAAARGSVDGIAFGGWTPIGAGLRRSADLLAGVPGPRAVLLISDGYENRAPCVAVVWARFPSGLRVFTIALGAAADAPLLQSIATDTGGIFYSSPTALDLHAIYNQIRSDMTDDGLILNDTGSGLDSDLDAAAGAHIANVEHGVDRLLISVSWADASAGRKGRGKPKLEVVAPSGRRVRANDWGVKMTTRADYAIVEILRPPPGSWTIMPYGPAGAYNVAAFVKSPLTVRVHAGKRSRLGVSAFFEDRPLILHSGLMRCSILPDPPLAWIRKQRKGGTSWSDTITPKDVLTMPRPQPAPPAYRRLEASVGKALDGAATGLTTTVPSGPHNVRLEIEGLLPGGAPFRRVVLRTIGLI